MEKELFPVCPGLKLEKGREGCLKGKGGEEGGNRGSSKIVAATGGEHPDRAIVNRGKGRELSGRPPALGIKPIRKCGNTPSALSAGKRKVEEE